MNDIIKANETITGAQLKHLIDRYGIYCMSYEDCFYTPLEIQNLQINDSDQFITITNYGHEVQFHLISENQRCSICINLCGTYSHDKGWHVVCQ